MFWVIFYKKYNECIGATNLSMMGSGGILLGLFFSPLVYFVASDIGWMDWVTFDFFMLVLFFLGGGIYCKWKAPRYADKVMHRRISEDYEYGRYIANKYPQYISLVKEIQPLYNAEDPRPIIDYLLEAQKAKEIPTWEKIIRVIILILALLTVYLVISIM